MQHISMFQLIKIATYLLLSIFLNKVIMSVLTTCNMHLSFKNLNPTPTKNLLSKFQNLYIFTNHLSIESLLHLTFLFFVFQVATYAYLFVLEGFTCCIDS